MTYSGMTHVWPQPYGVWPRPKARRTPVAATLTPCRNDPCPCGSGRKFKKCCINRKEPTQ